MKAAISVANILVVAAQLNAKEFHVATMGDDANQGRKSAPFQTIQRAADLAGDLCRQAAKLGVPHGKLFTHAGGWKENEVLL